MGGSLPAGIEADLRDVVQAGSDVVHIDTFRTVFVGPQEALVTVDVSFDPGMGADGLDVAITTVKDRVREADERVRYAFVESEI